MNIKSIYDTVTLNAPCDQNSFLTHLDMTIRSIAATYGDSYVFSADGKYISPRSIDADVPVESEYFPSICENIEFLLTGNEIKKVDFVQNAQTAYKKVWSRHVKDKRMYGGWK